MLVTYHAALSVYAALRPDEGLHQRRMRALAMTVSYAVNLVEHSDEADDLLRTFAKRFGFPAALDYQVAYRAIMSDYEHEASPEIIRQLELGMQYPFLEVNDNRSDAGFRRYVQQALDKLRDSPSAIGQATFELIVTGRVNLDELRDVTVADYQRLRRELLRDGAEALRRGVPRPQAAGDRQLRPHRCHARRRGRCSRGPLSADRWLSHVVGAAERAGKGRTRSAVST